MVENNDLTGFISNDIPVLGNDEKRRCGDLPLVYVDNLKKNTIGKKIPFDLSPQYLWNLFLNQNGKCSLSGMPLEFNSFDLEGDFSSVFLDMIDRSLGYIEGNVRWIHKNLSIMRGSFTDDVFLEYCRRCFLNNYSIGKIERPTFDEYFLNIAFDVSLRSDDPDIRHGSVIVTSQNHIIGTGYNATIRGSDKSKIPYKIRDKKRLWMIHAEENAILNCTTNPLTIGGSKIYITGTPCVNCLQRIINFGINEIIYAKRVGSITENDETNKMRQDIILMSGIKIREFDLDNVWLKKAVDVN
jgi:dCMP deaminase